MDKELESTVIISDKEAQYDEKVKCLLSNKKILSHILVRAIAEFKGMSPKMVEAFIEGEVHIGKVYVDNGLTNAAIKKKGKRIVGFNTENSEVNEGYIRYDIIFYVRIPTVGSTNGELSQIIVNIEAQKNEPSAYALLNRAIFYASRMISSQKERDFTNTNYDDIKKVYSIWICMNMKECIWNHVHLTNDRILGSYNWKGNLDLINIVLLGLPKELPKQSSDYELHRLLNTLLSMEITADEKLDIIKNEYDILTDNDFEEEVNIMCNLGRGAIEYGIELGIEKGIEQGIERGIEKGIEQGIEKGIEQGIEKGIEQGIEKGIEQGALQKAIECVDGIMQKCGISLDEACEIAKITLAQYKEYKDKLCVK